MSNNKKNRRQQASKFDRYRRGYDAQYRLNLAGREASDFMLENEASAEAEHRATREA